MNITVGTVTSRVLEEVSKDYEVSTVYNFLLHILKFLHISNSKLNSFQGLLGKYGLYF